MSTVRSTFVLPMAEIIQRQAILNLGTLGNVSEGKSTFVRALSGVATQKFKKEKQTNITIHLGYAGFKIWRHDTTGDLKTTPPSTTAVEDSTLIAHYSFVDCPGHEAYLATMLSGAAIMDAAALMVAANSPGIPQIQTQEHLMAAELMRLGHVFTVQNKLDVVADPAESLEKIRAFTKGTIAAAGPIIPMSAQLGWGLENAVHHLAYNMPQPTREFNGPLRMMIVRSFDINKPQQWVAGESEIRGGVIGGTILRGVLRPDDVVEIRPGIWTGEQAVPLLVRAKTLFCETTELPYAIAGGLIGVGTTLDPRFTGGNTLIGQTVGTPGTLPEITNRIKGKFKPFKRGEKACPEAVEASKAPFKEGEQIACTVGICTVRGKIKSIDGEKLEIILDRPVCAEKGQICGVLRQSGKRDLLAGTLTVRKVRAFDAVKEWSEEHKAVAAEAQAAVLAREYVVEEYDVRKDAEPLPSYEHMLDAIETIHTEREKKSVGLPVPKIEVFAKQIYWVNVPELFDSLRALSCDLPAYLGTAMPLDEFFPTYVKDELSTTLNVKPEGGYMVKGRFKVNNLKSILHKFMTEYYTCKQCRSHETTLFKSERIVKLYCGKCTSTSAVLQLCGKH